MTVRASIITQMTVTEIFDVAVPAAGRSTFVHNLFNGRYQLNATSTPPIDLVIPIELELVSGVATLDLTAVEATAEIVRDATGKKLRGLLFRNPDTNTNPLVIEAGASNGYGLLGADFKMTLLPGDEILAFLKNSQPTVGGSAKNIDFNDGGADEDEVHQILMVFG